MPADGPAAFPDAVSGRWHALMDAGRDAYVSIDDAGVVVEWNRRAEDLFGWSRPEAVDASLADLIVPERLRHAHREGLDRFVATARGNVAFQRLHLPAVDRDGRELDVEFTILPTPVGGSWRFHAFLRDVSSERLPVDYLTLLQRAATAANNARSVEDGVRSTLAAIQDVSTVRLAHAYLVDGDVDRLDPTGWWFPGPLEPFTTVTMATTFALGEGLPGRVAVSGQPAWIADLATDENFPRARPAMEAGLRAAFAFPVRAGDRVVAVIELFTKRPAAPNVELLDVMETVGTQLGRVFERQANVAELTRLAADREAIVAIVGHELRGPLAAAQMTAKTLADPRRRPDDDTAIELLGILDRQCDRLGRIVDTLMTAQRLESDAVMADPVDVRLADLVAEVVHDANIDDVDVTAPDDVVVRADPDHVAQILWNLLTNAVRHGRAPITLTSGIEDGHVVVTVRDEGDGVPEALQGQLFDRFARDASSPGAGLGLAIVRGLAEVNGGTATYEPSADGGPAFVVTLPRGASSTAPRQRAASPRSLPR